MSRWQLCSYVNTIDRAFDKSMMALRLGRPASPVIGVLLPRWPVGMNDAIDPHKTSTVHRSMRNKRWWGRLQGFGPRHAWWDLRGHVFGLLARFT
jgi:hypothetical protein